MLAQDYILMKSNKETKKPTDSSSGEVSHSLLPKITKDEIDLEGDNNRDDEIKRDKPPHHS